MKKWADLTDHEKIEITRVIRKFMDIMDVSALDPVGDVFKDVYFGVIRASLKRAAESTFVMNNKKIIGELNEN